MRCVWVDQRGHGRSGRGSEGSHDIDRLGVDLEQVLAAAAPEGPVVVVGHSMGGMTVLALADQRPDLFDDRVVGAGLLCTSSGGLAAVPLGLPRQVGALVHRAAPDPGLGAGPATGARGARATVRQRPRGPADALLLVRDAGARRCRGLRRRDARGHPARRGVGLPADVRGARQGRRRRGAAALRDPHPRGPAGPDDAGRAQPGDGAGASRAPGCASSTPAATWRSSSTPTRSTASCATSSTEPGRWPVPAGCDDRARSVGSGRAADG